MPHVLLIDDDPVLIPEQVRQAFPAPRYQVEVAVSGAQGLERLGRHTLALMDEAKQDVLRANVVVIEHPGFFLRQDDNPPRPVGKSLEHVVALLTAGNQQARRACCSAW